MSTQKPRFHVEPFKPEHIDVTCDPQGWAIFGRTEDFKQYLDGVSKYTAYTAFYDDKAVGAAGVIIPYRGVGEAWAIVLPGVRQCVRDFQKAVKRGLREIIEAQALHRVEAGVLESFAAGRSWAVSLGMKPEGRRIMAGPNKENIITFAMFPGGVWHKGR